MTERERAILTEAFDEVEKYQNRIVKYASREIGYDAEQSLHVLRLIRRTIAGVQ